MFKPRTLDPSQAIAMLTQVELDHRNKAWMGIIGGFALCLPVVVVVTVLYLILTLMSTGGPGIKVVFFVVGFLVIPPLFFVAHRFQRPLPDPTTPASQQLRNRRNDDNDTDDNDEVKALAREGQAFGEKLNLGPRLVLWGIATIRAQSAFGTVPIDRLATALIKLAHAGESISPAKLLLPGESADSLEPLLGVLMYHDLADLSKRADRVWITTSAKKKLGLPV
jgi:hypothetical protein